MNTLADSSVASVGLWGLTGSARSSIARALGICPMFADARRIGTNAENRGIL